MNNTRKLALCTFFSLAASAACTQVVDEPPTQPEALTERLQEGEDEAPRIEPEKIQHAMRSQFMNPAKQCFQTVLEDDAEAAGKVIMRFVIVDGVAHDIATTSEELDREPFLACLATALGGVGFPSADGEVTVSYPLAFSPD